MAPAESNVRKLSEAAAPQFRTAPQNLEAEQALLGAILVNNDAFYRVSDFLEPEHFAEMLHQQIYEVASKLIRAGKTASPITLKTFLPADLDIGGLNTSQYLARLAAETGEMELATSVVLLPLLNPVQLAEDAATINAITGGRFILGVGLGHQADERQAFGIAPEDVVPRFDEAMANARAIADAAVAYLARYERRRGPSGAAAGTAAAGRNP